MDDTDPADDEPTTPILDSRSIQSRLTETLSHAWAPIPHALIYELKHVTTWTAEGPKGPRECHLKPVHFYILVFLLSTKRDERDPYPSAKHIADRAGLSYTTVLEAMDDLEKARLIRRYEREGSHKKRMRYAYDLKPLLDRLDRLTDYRTERRTVRDALSLPES